MPLFWDCGSSFPFIIWWDIGFLKSWMHTEFCWMLFLHQLIWLYYFSSSVNMVNYIDWFENIELATVHPKVKLTWSDCDVFTNIFMKVFCVCVVSRYCSIDFLVLSLSGLSIRVMVGFIKWVEKPFSFLYFLQECRICVIFSFNTW